MMAIEKPKLRSEHWFNDRSRPDQTALHLERYLNFGLTPQELQSGKPIIGIDSLAVQRKIGIKQ